MPVLHDCSEFLKIVYTSIYFKTIFLNQTFIRLGSNNRKVGLFASHSLGETRPICGDITPTDAVHNAFEGSTCRQYNLINILKHDSSMRRICSFVC